MRPRRKEECAFTEMGWKGPRMCPTSGNPQTTRRLFEGKRALRSTRGNLVLRAVPVLAGVIAVLVGILWLPVSMSIGLIAIGSGIALAGVGGSLAITTPSGRISGLAGGVLILIGVAVAYLPKT